MNIDSLTYQTSRGRDGRWTTRCPQLDIRVTASTRIDSLQLCINRSMSRFYELDADRHFGVGG
jgi:hypothetical protein